MTSNNNYNDTGVITLNNVCIFSTLEQGGCFSKKSGKHIFNIIYNICVQKDGAKAKSCVKKEHSSKVLRAERQKKPLKVKQQNICTRVTRVTYNNLE